MRNDPTVDMHITNMVGLCIRTVIWILRIFTTSDHVTTQILWRAFVISRLVFYSQLCSCNSETSPAEMEAAGILHKEDRIPCTSVQRKRRELTMNRGVRVWQNYMFERYGRGRQRRMALVDAELSVVTLF